MLLRQAASCSIALMAMLCLAESSRAQTEPQTEAPPEKKEKGAMVRIVCVQSLSGEKDEEITLAQKTEDGKWIESGDLTLRSPCITDWVRVPLGPNNLVRKGSEEPVSLASFTISPDMKGAILILIPDLVKQTYRLQVIDPDKLEFRKGKALIMNYSVTPAVLNMGKESKTVAPGQQLIETITTDKDGMYPLRIGYLDKDKKPVLFYDRRASSHPNTRTYIMLFPDTAAGLRAMTFTEFGPHE